MKTGIRAGNAHKTGYKTYANSNVWLKNKIKRLERRVLKNENDTGAVDALKRVEDGNWKYSRNRKSRGHICKNDQGKFIQPKLPTLVVDQFYNLGLINEKRRDIVKARMGRIRRR